MLLKEIFKVIDAFMSCSTGELVKVLVMDGEACNTLVRQAVHGQLVDSRLKDLKWFGKLKFHSIKGFQDLPRCPILAATYEEEYIYLMPGVAHALKNANGQLTSELRVLYFGRYWADPSGTLANAMPLPAFSRLDPMSDRLAALLMSPQFLVGEPVSWPNLHSENQ